MRTLGYRPELDGVRGVAILLVLALHAQTRLPGHWAAGGRLGVDLFFVLSGLLITTLLLDEWDRRGEVSLRAFYGRRARRLLPALLTVVGVFTVLEIAVAPAQAMGFVVRAIECVSYIANFVAAFGHGLGPFIQLWSLAQEEQFYLLWPPILLLMLRRGARARHLLLVLAAAALAINLQRWSVGRADPSSLRIWYSPDTHGDAIIFGCAAGIVWSRRLLEVPKVAGPVALAVLAAVVAWFGAAGRPVFYPITLPLFAAASALLLLSLLEHCSTRLSRAATATPLRATGKISYGLYLWHFPLIALFGLPGLVMTPIVTVLSYRYIEAPFLRQNRRPARSHERGPAVLVPAESPS